MVSQIQKFVSAAGKASEMQRGMAIPGTFIVDRQGRVTSRFFEDFYVERNTTESVLLKVGAGAAPVAATKIATGQLDLATYASDATVAPGNRFSLVLDVTPHSGMHVYAPGAAGYRSIAVTIAPQPFVQTRPVQFPASEIYFFKPLNERVPVFQKPFRLVQEVLIEGSTQAQTALQGQRLDHAHRHGRVPGLRRQGLLQPDDDPGELDGGAETARARAADGDAFGSQSSAHCRGQAR